MRTFSITQVVVVVALAGCDQGSAGRCEASWTIAVFRGESGNEGADAHAAVAPDGSIVVTLGAPDETIRYGDGVLEGTHLSRVAADGTIIETVPTDAGPYGLLIGFDRGSRPTVVWGAGDARIVAYDTDLRVRWQRDIGIGVDVAFAVGPDGDVATHDRDAGLEMSTLRYLDASGGERWHRDDTYPFQMSVLANRDVVTIESSAEGPHRVVYRGSDGMILDDRPAPLPVAITADGRSVVTGFVDDTRTFVELYAASGTRTWRRELDSRGIDEHPVLASNGDVVLMSYGAQRVDAVRLDPATGEELSRIDLCGAPRLAGADAEGVVTIGPTGSASRGLARFE